jgi:hypothetical protein
MDLTFKLYMKIQSSQLYESVVQTLHSPCMCTILHALLSLISRSVPSFYRP